MRIVTYNVSSGKMYDVHGEYMATGYSGLGDAKNDPDREQDVAHGPIPRGDYAIGDPYESQRVGPFAIPLEPMPGTNVFGRSAFRIHGDSIAHPGSASHGCVILPRAIREAIHNQGATVLRVT